MSTMWWCKAFSRWSVRSAATLLVSACAAVYPPVSADASGPVDSALFSELQASRGSEVYGANCAVCHGAALTGGGGAPTLQGPDFLFGWSAKSTTQLVEYISSAMPPGQAHSLTGEEYEDVTAYILGVNGFPAGQADLSPATPKPIGQPPEPAQ